MNDLSVYYCPKCGRAYAYVQRNSHISCSACSYDMKLLSVSCTEFMHLSLEKRNVLILDHILSEAKRNFFRHCFRIKMSFALPVPAAIAICFSP